MKDTTRNLFQSAGIVEPFAFVVESATMGRITQTRQPEGEQMSILNDAQGCSTTQDPSQEQYEQFTSKIDRKTRVQYEFRSPWGELFTTVAPDLATARARRDKWIEQKTQK
jgi:hypothetical protein